MSKFDPNVEHNPRIALIGAFVLVTLAFGTVAFIVWGSEMKNQPAAMQ
jgi:hypothetical protein